VGVFETLHEGEIQINYKKGNLEGIHANQEVGNWKYCNIGSAADGEF